MLPAKKDHGGDQQPEKHRHEHRRNKPLSNIESMGVGHVTAFLVEAGAQTLSVTDNSPRRAVMPKAVTAPSSDSEVDRISPHRSENAEDGYEQRNTRQSEAIRLAPPISAESDSYSNQKSAH